MFHLYLESIVTKQNHRIDVYLRFLLATIISKSIGAVNMTMEDDDLWILEEENKARVISNLRGGESEVGAWPSSKESGHDAAVLVPMVIVDGEPSVLFTVRSQHISRHRQLVW